MLRSFKNLAQRVGTGFVLVLGSLGSRKAFDYENENEGEDDLRGGQLLGKRHAAPHCSAASIDVIDRVL